MLMSSQILGGLGVAIGIALAPVLATRVSGSEALSGLAPTASVAGTALLSLPLAALMTSRGRRPGLVLAYLVGALGAGLVVLATVVENFPLLLLGMAGFGAGSSANLQARFAAADLAEPDRRGRAISNVIWATTIGSVLGPNIAAPAGRVFRGTAVSETAGRSSGRAASSHSPLSWWRRCCGPTPSSPRAPWPRRRAGRPGAVRCGRVSRPYGHRPWPASPW